MTKFYIGSKGGGKGGGSQRTPVEDKDSLRSRAYAKLIDVVSEGQVGGLVNGLKSIYLDDVPLQNADGSYNFEDVAVEFKDGSIGQSALSNMDGVDSTQSINVALKYNIPAVRTINSPEADYARVSIAVGQLSKQNTSNGDVHGTSVAHRIEYRANGGAWQTVKTDVIEGKTMSGYERSVTFKLAGSAPWDVRITRTTADSASQALQNASKWSTLTSVIADKFRFPGTALLGMQINAEQFSNIPARAYHLKGLVIKVPSNYDPVTRVYSGAWNGTFKMAWTDNPVWCLYDLLTNERYGLGTRIDAGMIDKWELYQIAQYCDQLVPDGRGGMEQRFTCNLYLQTRTEAYKFIQDMAAIFRGISYWASGSIAVKSDMSSPVRYQFNNSNVENGVFERAGSNIQTRHNVALVTWNDPADMGRQKIEYVEDFDAIQKMGYVSETEVAAFGCTSQGQAHRLGEWLLYTEQYESEIVSFTAGADGAIPLPSDVIQISDVYRAGERRGGRVLAGSSKTSVKLDAPVTLATGKTYTLSTIDVDGGFQSATVTTGAGSHATLAVTPFAKDIAENATWILSDATLAPEIFKVIGVDEVENGKYKISCLSHNPSKYGYIEREQALTAPQTSNLQDQKPDVSDVVVTEVTATDKNDIPINKLNVSWKPANAASTAFFVEYRTDSGAWQRTPTSSQYFAEISPVAENVTYQIRVVAGNRLLGVWSNPQAIEYTPIAYQVPAITNLVAATAWSTGQDVTIKWDVVNAKAYEVQVLEGATVRRIIKATESTYTYTAQDYKADGCNTRSLTFKVRAISSNGRTGAWSQVVATNAQVGALQGISVSGSTEQAFFEYAKPADADFAGVIVWVGTTANFTPSDANKVYDGNDTVITLSKLTNGTKFTAGVTYYLKCAGYDTFGKDALAVSASVAFSVYSVTQMVTDLQATQLNQSLRTEIDKISGTGAGSVSARVAQEASNRATAIAAEASARATADTTESTARSNADSALSSRIDTVSASVTSNNTAQTAALQTEKTARINADGALGTRIDTVVAQANTDRTNAQALVTNEATARANADSAQAQQIGTLTATVNTNNTSQTAAVQNEATLRANADSANANAIQTVAAQLQAIRREKTMAFTSSSVVADWVNYVGGGEPSLVADTTARGGYVLHIGNNSGNDQYWGIHKDIFRVDDDLIKIVARWRRVSGAGGVYIGLAGVLPDGVTLIDERGYSGSFSNQMYVVSNAKPALGEWQTTTAYFKKGGAGNGSAYSVPYKMIDAAAFVRPLVLFNYTDSAGECELDYFTIEAVASSSFAYVDETKQVLSAVDAAQASQINTMQTALNGHTASIQTQANSIDGLSAQYTVKTDVNGYVSGYGLATTSNNGTPTSAFIINADKFGVGAAGNGTTMPFIVDTAKNTVGINGNTVVQGTLAASSVLIGDASNLVLDPFGANLNLWGKGSLEVVLEQWSSNTASDPITSGVKTYTRISNYRELMCNPKGAYGFPRPDIGAFTVTAGESYYVKCWVYKEAGNTPVSAYLGLRLNNGLDGVGAYPRINVDFSAAESGWKLIEGIVVVPDLVNGYPPKFALMHGGVGNTCTLNGVGVIFGGMVIRRANGGELIVDGGIRARHIGANEVTADKINVTNLEAVNANTGNLKATGAIYGGGYTTAHAGNNDTWPASGVTGFALSANGLKIGNKTNNKFIRITPDGNLYAPTWSSVNGKLTINQLDVIDTHNIVDDAVTRAVSFYSGADTMAVDFMSATITLTTPSKLVIFSSWIGTAGGQSNQDLYINESIPKFYFFWLIFLMSSSPIWVRELIQLNLSRGQ